MAESSIQIHNVDTSSAACHYQLQVVQLLYKYICKYLHYSYVNNVYKHVKLNFPLSIVVPITFQPRNIFVLDPIIKKSSPHLICLATSPICNFLLGGFLINTGYIKSRLGFFQA